MNTILKRADDIAGGDKLLLYGVIKEVYDADYCVPEGESTVGILLAGGDTLLVGSSSLMEVVVE